MVLKKLDIRFLKAVGVCGGNMKNHELKMGVKVESEHERTMRFISKYLKTHDRLPPKRLVFANIAKDHLKEDKKYYTKLRRARL